MAPSRSRRLRLRFVLSTLSVVLGAVACGSASDTDGAGGNGSGDPNNPFGSRLPDGGTGGSVGAVGAVTPGSACATSSAGTTRPPAHLVFVYDRSISMGDKVGGTTKWAACKTGLTNFFASASSAGISASLTFFGEDANESNADCSASSYVTPDVAMQALPNATSFANALNKTGPSTDTPTLPALKGGLQYAQSVKASLKNGEKVVVVLVTDGDPYGCSGNTPQAVHDAAAAVAATIPTYVVGIGNVTNLNTMAAGGGTKAILVSTSSPQQVTADLENALGQIASSQLGCEYALPAPPKGQTLDVNAVNVDYTPSGKPQTTLEYSADCSNANGWHYDSVLAPSKIIACPAICDRLKADKGGKVDIIFGCGTAVTDGGPPPK